MAEASADTSGFSLYRHLPIPCTQPRQPSRKVKDFLRRSNKNPIVLPLSHTWWNRWEAGRRVEWAERSESHSASFGLHYIYIMFCRESVMSGCEEEVISCQVEPWGNRTTGLRCSGCPDKSQEECKKDLNCLDLKYHESDTMHNDDLYLNVFIRNELSSGSCSSASTLHSIPRCFSAHHVWVVVRDTVAHLSSRTSQTFLLGTHFWLSHPSFQTFPSGRSATHYQCHWDSSHSGVRCKQ